MRVKRVDYKLVLPKSVGRSKGAHISDVLRDYALTTGTLDAKYAGKLDPDTDDTTLIQIGLAFEDYLSRTQHKEIEYHPGEVYVDCEFCGSCGISRDVHRLEGCNKFRALRVYMSPDGVSFPPEGEPVYFYLHPVNHILHELKFTQKSSRDFEEALRLKGKKARMWLWQIMSYCYALGTLAAKLHVCFVRGNYSPNFDDPGSRVCYEIFLLEFSQAELDANWELMSSHAQGMVLDGKL